MRSRFPVPALLGSALLAAALGACGGTTPVEDMPEGSTVALELQDGQVLTGTLTTVAPETVVLNGTGTRPEIEVPRERITGARQVEEEALEALAQRELVLPAGTTLDAALDTTVASNTSNVQDTVRATLASDLVFDGVTVAPRGSVLVGAVTAAEASGRVRGRAELGLRFDRLETPSLSYEIRTRPFYYEAEGTRRDDATTIGIGAAAGAVIGGLTGGAKGAAVGSAIGAGGGTAVVLSTPGEDIRLGAGTSLQVRLTEALVVAAPAGRGGE
ncbi:MAG: hypothetical protein HOP14_10025 [Acidobacteria bacterium]|nr:hypothetical protein [Acidobacteriota bacterium]